MWEMAKHDSLSTIGDRASDEGKKERYLDKVSQINQAIYIHNILKPLKLPKCFYLEAR